MTKIYLIPKKLCVSTYFLQKVYSFVAGTGLLKHVGSIFIVRSAHSCVNLRSLYIYGFVLIRVTVGSRIEHWKRERRRGRGWRRGRRRAKKRSPVLCMKPEANPEIRLLF